MVRWVQSVTSRTRGMRPNSQITAVCVLCHRVSSALRSSVEGAFYARDITESFVQYSRFWNSQPLWPHFVSLCLQGLPRIKAESAETATDSLAHKWRSNISFPQRCPCEDAMLKMKTAEKPLNSRLFLRSLWTWVSNERCLKKWFFYTFLSLSHNYPHRKTIPTRNF